ncbi:AI-2E family transporter [Haloferula sp.]|uniref:AI-2E family transporter n=1 Tax=Haloferula sp. TaxID=2497595 RepID=UPI003C78F4C8
MKKLGLGRGQTAEAMEVVIRMVVICGLVVWACFIIAPFIKPILWGAILASALYPVFSKIGDRAGGRRKLVGIAFILVSILVLIVPAVMLVGGSVEGVQKLVGEWHAGDLKIPEPHERIKEWPMIGEWLYEEWTDAVHDPGHFLRELMPHVSPYGSKLFGMVATAGADLIGFTVSLILAGIFMINGPACHRLMQALGLRLAGDSGLELGKLVTGTVRGVALGVVGTALIQATLAAIGMEMIGISLTALWAFLVLILAVIQLSPAIILLPIAIYVFSTHGGMPAVLFAILCVVVSTIDNFIKPVLMGRNTDTPMVVIMVGALGGLVLSGVMGLFLGAVVVALCYQLFLAWLYEGPGMDAGRTDP